MSAEPVPARAEVVYVTGDSSAWLRLSVPSGLISPPTIELHRPLSGPVTFYDAESFRLPVPAEARGG
jgi:hypothetical protein